MLLNMYAIYDVKSVMYFRPMFAITDDAALRAFGDLTSDPNENVAKHPEDYSLFKIGTYDDNTATLKPSDRVCMQTGLEAVAQRSLKPPTVTNSDGTMTAEEHRQLTESYGGTQ